MFETRINDQAPFLSDEANQICSGINSSNETSFDRTFVATARALLYRRAGSEKISICTLRHRNFIVNEVIDNFCYMVGDSKIILCLPREESGDDGTSVIEAAGFRKIDKVSQFFKKAMAVRCFVNDEKKETIVILDNATLAKYHYLQTAMLNYFPWYYEPGSEISDDEKAFIRSLGQRDAGVYLKTMEALLPKDLREITIRNLFQNFESQFDESRLSVMENEVKDRRDKLESLYTSLRSVNRELRDKMVYVNALREKIASGENNGELMEYLFRNKKIVSVSRYDARYKIIIKSVIADFDEDEAEHAIRNLHSSIYSGIPNGQKEGWRCLYNAIFLDRKIKINTCAVFSFATDGYVDAISGSDYPRICDDCLPNPHIHHHGCSGSFYDLIAQYAAAYDYIGVIETCISSAENLNFSDDIVMGNLSSDLADRHADAFLKMPDGSVVSPDEAIRILKETEEKENGEVSEAN